LNDRHITSTEGSCGSSLALVDIVNIIDADIVISHVNRKDLKRKVDLLDFMLLDILHVVIILPQLLLGSSTTITNSS